MFLFYRFSYTIKDGNDKQHFSLLQNTGQLVINSRGLDREVQPIYQLSIVAQDVNEKCHKGLMVLTVKLTDVNDNRPVFDTVQPVSVREDVPANQYITKVRAIWFY